MNINLTAPINDLGYGTVGINVLKSLVRNGCSVAYWPIGQPSVHDEESGVIVQQAMAKAQSFDVTAPSLRIWHQHDMAQHVGKGQRIGFPIFELNKFSDIERHHLASLDKIIVCSQWAKSVVEKEVPSASVFVAPLGVDSSIFAHSEEKENTDKTVFLNVGKWEVRKGHDILIDAFNKAFSKDDNVELWMMNHNPFLNEQQESEWHELYLGSELGDKIKIIPRVETHSQVARLMQQADVGVFPSRAEGWNLEALEMMALGKQVILTHYSAHTQFATEKNSKLINVDDTEDAYDGIWFHGQGEWGSLGTNQVNQLIEYMRELHREKPRVNLEGISTAARLTWDNCVNEISECLNLGLTVK